jgi:hypothetical protein
VQEASGVEVNRWRRPSGARAGGGVGHRSRWQMGRWRRPVELAEWRRSPTGGGVQWRRLTHAGGRWRRVSAVAGRRRATLCERGGGHGEMRAAAAAVGERR